MLSVTDLLKNFSVKGETDKPVKVWQVRESTKPIVIHSYKEKQRSYSWSNQSSCMCERKETFNRFEVFPVFLLQMKKRKNYGNHWIEVGYVPVEDIPEEYQNDVNAMIFKYPSQFTDLKHIEFFETKEEAEKIAKERTLERVEKKIDNYTGQIAERENEIKNYKELNKKYTAYFDKFKL